MNSVGDTFANRATSRLARPSVEDLIWLQELCSGNAITEAQFDCVDGTYHYRFVRHNTCQLRRGDGPWNEICLGGRVSRYEQPDKDPSGLHYMLDDLGARRAYITTREGQIFEYQRKGSKEFFYGTPNNLQEFLLAPEGKSQRGAGEPSFFKDRLQLWYDNGHESSEPRLITKPTFVIKISNPSMPGESPAGSIFAVGDIEEMRGHLEKARETRVHIWHRDPRDYQLLTVGNLPVEKLNHALRDYGYTLGLWENAVKSKLAAGQKDEELIQNPYFPYLRLRFPEVPEPLLHKAMENWTPETFHNLVKANDRGPDRQHATAVPTSGPFGYKVAEPRPVQAAPALEPEPYCR